MKFTPSESWKDYGLPGVGAPLVNELKVGVSMPESWNDLKLPLLCLYVQHFLINHFFWSLFNILRRVSMWTALYYDTLCLPVCIYDE
ncbi:hypothetical protein BDN71DRAFT_1445396 [Pleurotus eryngii]|uniref:Uncharacterized protein n=1 Tax=Pleurotus eryngii TaxID=5323 RepID=A0A9P5ZZK1_PLEER|nr:hypothetical protein BDN71DRAFT_1445396 [Pleurotus eryngii]